jgi:thioredoxin 1
LKRNNKKSPVIFMILLFSALLFISCGKRSQGVPKLLDLGADSCVPCQMMAPILDELREEYRGALDVVFIDVWKPENQQEAVKYGIRAIPTQIFFDPQGNELWRHTGFMSKEDILKKWKELGYDLKPVKQENIQDCATGCGDLPEGRVCE